MRTIRLVLLALLTAVAVALAPVCDPDLKPCGDICQEAWKLCEPPPELQRADLEREYAAMESAREAEEEERHRQTRLQLGLHIRLMDADLRGPTPTEVITPYTATSDVGRAWS